MFFCILVGLYIGIALLKFLKNSMHHCNCKNLKQKFDYNYQIDSSRNYEILDPVKRHFHRTGTKSAIFSDQHYLSNPSSYVYPHIMSCFNHALGKYISRKNSCFFWFFDIFDKILIIRVPQKLKENRFLSAIFMLIQTFVLYLFECSLDIWGIGNKTASLLHEFLTDIWHLLLSFFQ